MSSAQRGGKDFDFELFIVKRWVLLMNLSWWWMIDEYQDFNSVRYFRGCYGLKNGPC